MALKSKYFHKHEAVLRDARPWTQRMVSAAMEPSNACMVLAMSGISMFAHPLTANLSDLTFVLTLLYFRWLSTRKVSLPFKLPKSAKVKDPNEIKPGGGTGLAEGILYLGNECDTGEEIWFTNSDIRTHCLYLGTTGAGKTFGLKSYACNALTWASGFIYIDGKADTSLWSTIFAQVRRFGRDDDIMIMNYMTGNATGAVASNTLNPFSSGSASYLTNMLTSLMPDSEGDNAMWKERAVALVAALMPCLVWKRDNQNIPMSIAMIREYLTFKAVIKLSRDKAVPEELRASVKAYLDELPGYVDNVFDDNGDEKPDGGSVDTTVPRQQHGYLSMQFTRSMQSLGDDYGFIFDTQAADIDIMDCVLNRRILIVMIPALEKSGDETANLGKIISATLKGMMGATLGNTVEGESATVIENKPTNSATPFIAIFDEVGYYTAAGMAVMAAQARSLGFSLVFAGQDMPALEKRVKEEARSITANCNIKLFGKLEDPTQTKDFFEKTVGTALVVEISGYSRSAGGNNFTDSQQAGLQQRARAHYDGLKGFNEGRAICAFGKTVAEIQTYFSHIGDAKAMRVHRFLPIPPPKEDELESLRLVNGILKRLRDPKWKPEDEPTPKNKNIAALAAGFAEGRKGKQDFVICSMHAVAAVAEAHGTITPESASAADAAASKPQPAAPGAPPPPSPEKEIAAAGQLTNAGASPMNWAEVIGDGGLDAAPAAPRKDPPVTAAPAAATTTPATGATVTAPAEGGEAAAPWPPFLDPIKVEEAEKQVTEALAPQGEGPMNWMNIIGAEEPAAPQTAPAAAQPPQQQPATQQPAAAPPAEQQQPPAAPAGGEEAEASAWPPFLDPAKMAEAEKEVAEKRAQEGEGSMNWMDVIGGGTDE